MFRVIFMYPICTSYMYYRISVSIFNFKCMDGFIVMLWGTCGKITPGYLICNICNDLSVVLICLKLHNYNFGSQNMATRTSSPSNYKQETEERFDMIKTDSRIQLIRQVLYLKINFHQNISSFVWTSLFYASTHYNRGFQPKQRKLRLRLEQLIFI